ncbi:MAG: hypothetical protein QW587_05055 [Candidatus Bathyarchaeia archaeon]
MKWFQNHRDALPRAAAHNGVGYGARRNEVEARYGEVGFQNVAVAGLDVGSVDDRKPAPVYAADAHGVF